MTHTRFLENDIQQNASALLSYTRLNEKLKAENEQAARETESLRKNWDFEQKELEGKNPEAVELWQWIRDISLKEFNKVYDMLNIKFDSYNGERLMK